jgi:Tfp pilus assembly protein PilF
MRASADLEATTEKHPVTPGAVIPSGELLAEMLLEQRKPAEALKEVEKALAVAPGRYNGILVAARAADASGNRQKAEQYYRDLIALAGSTTRPEVQVARNYSAQK